MLSRQCLFISPWHSPFLQAFTITLPEAFIWLPRHAWLKMQGNSDPQQWSSINAKCELKKDIAVFLFLGGDISEGGSRLSTAVPCWLMHTALTSFSSLSSVTSQINYLHADPSLRVCFWGEPNPRLVPSKSYCNSSSSTCINSHWSVPSGMYHVYPE